MLAMQAGIRHLDAGTPARPTATQSPQTRASSWDREIASSDEAGRRLVLEGTARDSAGGRALPGFVFLVYQADAEGEYGTPGPDGELARLSGFIKTGPEGQFRIRTVLPGTYGGPPHLHFEFHDLLGAMRMSFVNLFPPLEGNYSAYGADFPRSYWKPAPGLKRSWISGPSGRVMVTQPADLGIAPDSSGVFRVKWDLEVNLSVPNPARRWGPEAPH